ncbi:helix-turn-helix domain-containing protein [Phycicoccus sp. Soil802]|uniref:helix-turn-helix domain-containing protein n=1 Tax=Phycicoccus sp. Soil802 TaxID=1736414 RepID=UPI000702E9C5|nr:helix-turn-helix domain-containing protein [Phycicoccus sp. Soil802]KRF29459.1 hypothetical protein ASG91_00020 [Phycicoccus sp. Soil802]
MINAITLSQTRTELGLSQRKLATLTGLNYQVIRRLELGGDDGGLTLRELGKICEALNLDPAQLLTGRKRIEPPTPAVGTSSDELDLSQARLLRRLQMAHDPRRILSDQDRQTVLPSLIRCGLVRTAAGGSLRLTPQAEEDLAHPELLNC